MDNFTLTIKRPDYKGIDVTSLLMCLFAVVAFVYNVLENHKAGPFNYIIATAIILWCVYIFIKSKKTTKELSYSPALLIGAIGWFINFADINMILGLPYLVACVFEKNVKTPVKITVNKDVIIVAALISKKNSWRDMNNVLLKDGLLTIDYKNNKLFQKEIENTPGNFSEKEFNTFCRAQLNKA